MDFRFTEGPVWMPGSQPRLYFSDIPGNKLYSWSDELGVQTVLDPVFADDERFRRNDRFERPRH